MVRPHSAPGGWAQPTSGGGGEDGRLQDGGAGRAPGGRRVPGVSEPRAEYREGGGHGALHRRGTALGPRRHLQRRLQRAASRHGPAQRPPPEAAVPIAEEQPFSLYQVDTSRIVHIHSVIILRRSDKRKDRVEISPEQLSAASTEAEISFGGSAAVPQPGALCVPQGSAGARHSPELLFGPAFVPEL